MNEDKQISGDFEPIKADKEQVGFFSGDKISRKDGFYITVNLFDTQPQTAANYGIFFIAWQPCEVLAIQEVHGTLAGAAATVTVEKLTGTTAKGSGTTLLITAFDLTVANNTVQKRQSTDFATSSPVPRQLVRGDRLALKSTGTIAAVKDLQITLYCKFLGRGDYF